MNKKEAMAELGLKEGYTEDDVKKAYRSLSSKYHPDKEGGSAEKMSRINQARDILNSNEPEITFENGWNSSHREFHRRFFRGDDRKIVFEVSFSNLIHGMNKDINVYGRTINIKFVPGQILNGQLIKMTGLGGSPQHPDAEPGDLYIQIVCTEEDGIHVLDRFNTCSIVDIDMFTAINGGKLEIKTPHGSFNIVIKPNDGVFKNRYRLGGKGLPMSNTEFGYHMAELNVIVPTKDEFEKYITEQLNQRITDEPSKA